MQFFVNINKANQVYHTAPTIETVRYQVGKYAVRLESFDYGLPMGWASAGNDIRARTFIDDALLPPFEALIWERRRPGWLPKDITLNAWTAPLLQLMRERNWG
jgi:hypothetical protein